MNLFLWINQSNGDSLGTIPLIDAILKQFPEVNLKFACFHDQAYLFRHLPIEIIAVDGDYKNMFVRNNPYYFLNKIKNSISEEDKVIHLWGGPYGYIHTWENQVKTFNNQCKEKNIDLILDDSEFGYIELPIVDSNVKENAVYVENSHTLSAQTNFRFNMFKLGLMFPKINFYTTGSVKSPSANVHDCSSKNLIELSSISRKCKLILGKGSGPFFCTLNKDNKDKPKALMGVFGENRYKFWNIHDQNTQMLDTEQEMFELLRPISRGK